MNKDYPSYPFLKDIPYLPADVTTTEVVKDFVATCDGRAACNKEDLQGIICAILGMRDLKAFKLLKSHDKVNFTKGQKVAIDQVLRHLMGDLLVGITGEKNLYRVSDKIKKPTKVRPDLPNEFKFRVTGEYVNYPSAKAVPCPEAVSLISGNRACTVTLPDVATTFQYILNGQDLPPRLGKLEPLDDIAGGKDFTKEFRQVVHKELTRSGYMGLLIDDDSDTALTFVVCSQWAKDFPTFLEQITRPWFRHWKLDLVKFYAEIEDHFGSVATVTGQPTMQLLRQSAGLVDRPKDTL
ncbi:hypothetical protein C7964_102327 [Loktanella sp. PT4BL]|jgi:hypothetical protein|uniref:hypothetical protein n=1 Tax=Loktanella sp. PT4BL TaxID=2135611 RepID=UPI000D75961D|nr:hypothetical protein [Loktanella sp. PT4BL]PXW70440.1 hypothetical protein C7964_102327 [Loktanella sp. PT4BL]